MSTGIGNILIISLGTSVLIAVLLLMIPVLDKHYSARWRYFVWLIVTLRLILPFNIVPVSAPVQIPVTESSVDLKMSELPLTVAESNTEWREETSSSGERVYLIPIMTKRTLFTLLWFCGAAAFALFQLICHLRFRLAIRGHLSDTDIKDVKICPLIGSPLVTGLFKPLILLPSDDYSDKELEFILAHERTHIRRHDLWYKLLLLIANAVHWFNPIVYLMVRRAARDLEYSCDYLVVKDTCMDYRRDYSMTILKYTGRKD